MGGNSESQDFATIWDLLDATDPDDFQRRFALDGPWNFGDPVHERISQRSLEQAGLIAPGTKSTAPELWEYLRGVFWNDDPQCQLFKADLVREDRFSAGIEWAADFKRAERKARSAAIGPDHGLLARSHFGDLQFLHAMADRDELDASVTRGKVLGWAELMYRVATGEIAEATSVGAVTVPLIRELFRNERDWPVSKLLGVTGIGDVQKRALGSLLHLLQDSYAAGHVERESLGGTRRGKIVCFYSYANQNHGKHKADDGWRGGATDDERLARVTGALDAVEQGAEIARRYKAGATWRELSAHLEAGPFALSDVVKKSQAGRDYT